MSSQRWSTTTVVISGVLALGLIAAGLFATGTIGGSSNEESEPVLLEAATLAGPDPFTPPVSVGDTGQPSAATGGGLVSARAPGLYGGTGDLTRCDKAQLAAFLGADRAKAAAWAGVRGIPVDAIAAYIDGLTPKILTVDARVTNHGFRGGVATPRQSVLQAGTAVLVDDAGEPVVRCKCGNPLKRGTQPRANDTFQGSRWSGFDPTRIVRVVQPDEVPAATSSTTDAPSPSATPTPSDEPLVGNLVVNGGFETGAYGSPWGTGIYEPKPEAFWGSANASAVIDADARSGAYALKITNSSPASPQIYRTVSQQIAVTTGDAYCLSFAAKAEEATPGILSIAVNDAWTVRSAVAPATTSYAVSSLTFTAEKGTVDVRLITENTGTVWVDDIAVTHGACA